MSIGPIEGVAMLTSGQADHARAASSQGQAHSASGAGRVSQPVPGTLPTQENSARQKATSTYELPQDVVEVHQDPDVKDQIIIQYLDQARNIVLQIPSNEELAVERGIAQEFQQTAKLRAASGSATEGSKGEETYGD
ncbi:MAG: hypothetical protein WAK29_15185 [Terriglobales bacterium]